MAVSTLKQKLGCWLNERWNAELVMRCPGLAKRLGWSWLDLCNRNESLHADPVSGGRICEWTDSSSLTLGKTFPGAASRLFRHCFNAHSVDLSQQPAERAVDSPDASILIAIGGSGRLPLLNTVLKSLYSQVGVRLEIIVCELGAKPELEGKLASSVRYVFVPQGKDQAFNKSKALNEAAKVAKGRVFFVHDGDFVVPNCYVSKTLRMLADADAVRPVRLLFYLDQTTTNKIIHDGDLAESPGIENIVQNTPNPMAITAQSYFRVGGHDEDYAGWGGEDTEMLSRLRIGKVVEGGALPIIHLWHPAAAMKASGDRNNELHRIKEALSPEDRIQKLVALQTQD